MITFFSAFAGDDITSSGRNELLCAYGGASEVVHVSCRIKRNFFRLLWLEFNNIGDPIYYVLRLRTGDIVLKTAIRLITSVRCGKRPSSKLIPQLFSCVVRWQQKGQCRRGTKKEVTDEPLCALDRIEFKTGERMRLRGEANARAAERWGRADGNGSQKTEKLP